jgi:hypothetical protein
MNLQALAARCNTKFLIPKLRGPFFTASTRTLVSVNPERKLQHPPCHLENAMSASGYPGERVKAKSCSLQPACSGHLPLERSIRKEPRGRRPNTQPSSRLLNAVILVSLSVSAMSAPFAPSSDRRRTPWQRELIAGSLTSITADFAKSQRMRPARSNPVLLGRENRLQLSQNFSDKQL